MTEEQIKANELYNKFRETSPVLEANVRSKKRAIITCDEMLIQLNTMYQKFNETGMIGCGNHTLGKINFWEKVKNILIKS